MWGGRGVKVNGCVRASECVVCGVWGGVKVNECVRASEGVVVCGVKVNECVRASEGVVCGVSVCVRFTCAHVDES